MLFSDASGHKVVSTATADTVGKVHEFVVDPQSRRVVAMLLKKTDGGDTLPWSNVTAFGPDAVTVADAQALTDPPPEVAALTGKDHHVLGKRVLTTAGDEIGKVTDVDFDPQTAAVTELLLKDEHVAGDRLLGVGSWAVVVQA